MRIHGKSEFLRAAAWLMAVAMVAGAVLIAAPEAEAQVKDWKKIKYPPIRPFEIPQPERFELANGMVVLMMEDHELPLIEMTAVVRTGSRLEPAEKASLASITGAVMRTGGAGDRTGDEIDDWLDGRGAEIETGIGMTSGTGGLSCLKEDFPEVLKLFSDILRRPRFEEEKIEVTKTQTKAGIARRNDQPMGIMFREGNRLAYGADSPYARSVEYDTVDAVTRKDLLAWHKKYFIPNRVYLGVVGDFRVAEMKKLLSDTFGGWSRGPDFEDPVAAYQEKPKAGIYHIVKEDLTQSNIIMGHLGIRRDDPDYYAAQVMNNILSGSFAARLFNNIRTVKGLAYAVTGNMGSNFDYPGTFNLWMTTKTESTGESIAALLEEVDALLAAPPTDEEMERALDSMLNSFIFNYDTPSEILQEQLTMAYYGYPSDFLAKYRERIEKVTAEEIHALAKKRIKKEEMAILVVGKKEGFDRPLSDFGQVAMLDITIPEPSGAGDAVASLPKGMTEAQANAKGAEIVARIVKGVGGEAAVDGVQSLLFSGEMTIQTHRGEMALQGVQEFVLPDRIRQEMKTPMGQISMVASAKDAFMASPMGVQELPGSQRDDLLKSLNRNLVVLLKGRAEAGFSSMYAGKETVEGVECDLVAVTRGEDTIVLAAGPDGNVMKAVYHGSGPQGVPGKVEVYYSDFREAGGLVFPFSSRQIFEGEPLGSAVYAEITVNHQVDEAKYVRPESPGSGEPSAKR